MLVVFGSINLDLVARVARSPAPGETLAGSAFFAAPGGKGANQALAARRSGAEVALFGAVGPDDFAVQALAGLRAAGVDLGGVAQVEAPTGVALIHVADSGENSIVVIPGANVHARATQATDALTDARILLMQLEVPLAEVDALAQQARARDVRCVLNASPIAALPRSLLEALDLLIVNEHEAAALAAATDLPLEPAPFARAYADRFGRQVVVTLGAQGALAIVDGRALRAAPPAVNVRDTTGAGDAFAGALCAALDHGADLAGALADGVAAGALACEAPGAQSALADASRVRAAAQSVELFQVP